MMYIKTFKDGSSSKLVSYKEALHTILGTYKDNEEVRDWLEQPGTINCMYSVIEVK